MIATTIVFLLLAIVIVAILEYINRLKL